MTSQSLLLRHLCCAIRFRRDVSTQGSVIQPVPTLLCTSTLAALSYYSSVYIYITSRLFKEIEKRLFSHAKLSRVRNGRLQSKACIASHNQRVACFVPAQILLDCEGQGSMVICFLLGPFTCSGKEAVTELNHLLPQLVCFHTKGTKGVVVEDKKSELHVGNRVVGGGFPTKNFCQAPMARMVSNGIMSCGWAPCHWSPDAGQSDHSQI